MTMTMTGTKTEKHFGRRAMAAVGGAALIAMIAATAGCSGSSNQTPSTSTTTTTTTTTPPSTPPPSPTEKSIDPHGGNLFTPPVTAPGAPGVAPGQHPGINGVP
jgi:hypothetical protein